MMTLPYKCVNCGSSVQDLYKKYSPTVLKLIQCNTCQQVADKYIEYDLVIIMIDLVLLNKGAYRHILYNSPFENHWKLAVVILLTEAYSEWVPYRSKELSVTNSTIINSQKDLFAEERSFYSICSQSIIGSAMFLLLIFALTTVRWSIHPNTKPACFSWTVLWKCLVLSSFGKFLLIPGLIWGVIGSETNSLFIMGYTFLSQLQAYSVVCNTPRFSAGVIVLLGLSLKLLTRKLISDLRIDAII